MAFTLDRDLTVYRFAPVKYASKLDGAGAMLHGGRWNEVGSPVVYASLVQELALAEASRKRIPGNMIGRMPWGRVSITLKSGLVVEEITEADLANDWHRDPAPASVTALGEEWRRSGNSCVLLVPSAMGRRASLRNAVIDPYHPEFGKLGIVSQAPYPVDHEMVLKCLRFLR